MSEVKMLKGTETLASLAYARDNDGHIETIASKGLPADEKPRYEYDANSRRPCPRIWILVAMDRYNSRACVASRAWGVTALLWLCAVVVAGCGSARQMHIPAIPAVRTAGENPAAVRVNLPVGWTYHDSAVAHWGANTWFALVTPAPHREARDVQIYRLEGGLWRLNATVETRAFPPIERVEVAWLTGSGAPDFTVHDSGADTPWLAVISRAGGRWHQVPFNRPPDVSRSFVGGVEDNLIHISLDGGGGAAGPTTNIWYRYDNGAFIPTRSPDEPERCTKSALENSQRLQGRPEGREAIPWTAADLTRHLDVQQFACMDGWAATASPGQAGARNLAFYVHQRGQWLRAAEGTPARVASGSQIFAAPPTILDRLAADVGTPIAVAHQPFGAGYEPGSRAELTLPAPERATLSFPDPPGSIMSATIVRENDNGAMWLATAIEEPPVTASSYAHITAAIYRWASHAWKRQTEIAYTADRSGSPRFVEIKGAYITGSSTPDFAVTRSYTTESQGAASAEGDWTVWTSVISDVHHRWEMVPFVQHHRPTAEVQATTQPVHPAEAEDRESGAVVEEHIEPEGLSGLYNYHAGAFELKPYGPSPTD
jgi:hypothetical protein